MIQPAVPYTGEPATLPLHMIDTKAQIRMRNGLDQESLTELSETIQTHGLMQPLVVRRIEGDRYELVAGERRLLACSMAGLAEVPVLIRDVLDEDVPALQAIENLQRVDLTILDKADGVAAIVGKLGAKRAASMLGKSPAWVSKLVQISKQPDAIRELAEFVDDVASLGLLRQLRAADKAVFTTVAAAITDGRTYSRDQLNAMVRAAKKPAPEPDAADDGQGDLLEDDDKQQTVAEQDLAATVTVPRWAANLAFAALDECHNRSAHTSDREQLKAALTAISTALR